jgi:hypothetical protein
MVDEVSGDGRGVGVSGLHGGSDPHLFSRSPEDFEAGALCLDDEITQLYDLYSDALSVSLRMFRA